MAPKTSQRTTFEKDRRANSRTVMDGEALDIKDSPHVLIFGLYEVPRHLFQYCSDRVNSASNRQQRYGKVSPSPANKEQLKVRNEKFKIKPFSSFLIMLYLLVEMPASAGMTPAVVLFRRMPETPLMPE